MTMFPMCGIRTLSVTTGRRPGVSQDWYCLYDIVSATWRCPMRGLLESNMLALQTGIVYCNYLFNIWRRQSNGRNVPPRTSFTLQWVPWCLKSSVILSFVQQLARANNKKTIKAPHYWALCEENPPVHSLHKRPVMGKVFLCHDVTMLQGWPFGGRFNRDGASGNGLLCTRFFGTNDQHVVRCHGRGRLSHSRWNSPWLDDVIKDDGDDDDDDGNGLLCTRFFGTNDQHVVRCHGRGHLSHSRWNSPWLDDVDDDDDDDDDDDNKMMLILHR